MKRESATANLHETISLLKLREKAELQALKKQFHLSYESLKPVNLIKSTLKNVTSSQGIKGTLLKTVVGLATAYFSKRLLFRVAQKPIKKVLGTLLGMGIARFVASKVKKEKEPASENSR